MGYPGLVLGTFLYHLTGKATIGYNEVTMNQGKRVTTNDFVLQATCQCGTLEHGTLVIDVDMTPGDPDPAYLQFKYSPYQPTFIMKLRNAWNLFFGKVPDCDFMMSLDDMEKVGTFFTAQAARLRKAQEVADAIDKKKLTLQELKEIVNNEPSN